MINASIETFTESPLHIAGCGCAACTGYIEAVGSADRDYVTLGLPDEASVDRLAGSTASNGKTIWTADQAAAYLNRTGTDWTERDLENNAKQSDSNLTEITFGFHESRATLAANGYVDFSVSQALPEYFNFTAFTSAQRDATRLAMSFWDDVAAISFREAPIGQADIAFGGLANAPDTQAYAYLPYNYEAPFQKVAGDVWVSASQASNFQFGTNGYGQQTLTHEIGHTLGLSHPGNYNFSANFTANYANALNIIRICVTTRSCPTGIPVMPRMVPTGPMTSTS
jgi:hypothetical protein